MRSTSSTTQPPARAGTRPLLRRLAALPRLSIADAAGAPTDVRMAAEPLARALRTAGAGPGTCVAVLLPNGPAFVSALLACLEVGAAFAPLHPLLPADEQARRLARLGASVVLGPEGLRPLCPAVPAALPPDVAVVLFTSGSAGGAKAVALSQEALAHVVETHLEALALAPGAAVLGYLSWCHAFGFTLELLLGLLGGAALRSVAPEAFPEAFAAAPPDLLFTVPRMLQRLPDGALRAVQGGLVGGAPVRGELRRRLAHTRLRVGYGQTECGPGAALGAPGEWEHDDFLGRPVGCELALEPLADGALGELRLRGPNLAHGYVEDGRVRPLALRDGWLSTGDLASAADGAFVFQGRRDELFKLDNGRMFNPAPFERPYQGRVLLVAGEDQRVLPLVRGDVPAGFALPVPHHPPRPMPEAFWDACTNPTGKVSRWRAERLAQDW